mmetsp:Transcript_4865/g.7320  ORF Transcript_4865/g.7320 Transcript_4865/m.7320 type:complete len:332 (-) Transcript_4865:275-1270(-)|eukprot:CAMPEP_0113943472 /NCGR_PEP_ID=MMETSP1339-20121228/24718_1 /TAXON_ID=94617 /ORGANISM="Fibrocapsa japonica" /LENGTH=331 /DNA_ID=CAMNT_0000948355 /DNA_START=68 /DNA_END=1063 /DNA_ORIENTATION=+ /assembly_acc=CAM_ASM_000762
MIFRALIAFSIFAAANAFVVPKLKLGGRAVRSAISMLANEDIHVMMNGLPGAMGKEVAAACLRRGYKLAPYALTGPGVSEETIEVDDLEGGQKVQVQLIRGPVSEDAPDAACDDIIPKVKSECPNLICIDYTHPTAVNGNAAFYAKHKLNFVMGTTGGDREKLLEDTKAGGHYAIIAPNMAKQIVALQAALKRMSEDFPGAYAGYELEIEETHQATKADTSGTAKAIAQSLAELTGEPYDLKEIKMIRDTETQMNYFGVPEEYLKGHAFHTYSLKAKDGTTEFQFRHNVLGRRIYAEGTADAVKFIAEKAVDGSDKKVYDMMDVLKSGAMQ